MLHNSKRSSGAGPVGYYSIITPVLLIKLGKLRSPQSRKLRLHEDGSHSFGGSPNDHSHTVLNFQITPCLKQHIPQSILNGFPLPLITLITSTYLLADVCVNLQLSWKEEEHHFTEGRNKREAPVLLLLCPRRLPSRAV